nr:acyl carrier protein [Candidatus Annandia adelgestsuga]
MNKIENNVKNIISKKIGIKPKKILNSSSLQDLGADSLDIIEIIIELEEFFKIKIYDHESEKINKIEKIINIIKKKIKKKKNNL